MIAKLMLIISLLFSFPVYDIPMDYQLQKYTYEVCQEYDLSYELVLAVIKTESNFKTDAKNNNSIGLMQLNTGTIPDIEKELGIKIDPYDPYQNILGGVWYLDYLRQYWLDQGYSDEEVFDLMLSSYNQGISNQIKYGYKFTQKYIDKVYNYKIQLEQNGALFMGDLRY